MSGHSKWKNILHKKEKTDAQRAKIFTKIGREMAVAVKEGGPDPASNSKLAACLAKAKANNVPNDNIKRIIERASGADGANYETIVYEGYGPCGVAVIVETMTDNRNRTASEVRHYFDKYGGNLGATGCVGWQFDNKGIVVIERAGADEDDVMLACLDAGADDVEVSEEVVEVYCDPTSVVEVSGALEAAGYTVVSAESEMVPQTYTKLENEDDIKNMQKLLDMLEDNDDVQNVYHNWEEEE
ncbi:MAG: YebC/PmpR family DNA-binding transcriptional regulator [Oscillospiraceae bacterium]|nr:YebC/PmpR family DNA-binding transcriptional regulator [Oscillospiraceae bacterium]MBQ2743453.1 YebC/PmpR family DNA-binding transcriptional regulator [Oscillospiraceae bacterium]MBQ6697797.1 YebC/PmpR family DNA-binding transcriptional regulator [Oscillospiraceae bacterium]MBQ7054926.1 YebC/PmpR family DNA-binding transcriptional regulator [Oscillospiraceae bacterium]MBR2181413.1 YebC/PmpR family DNA-binding transcriptional regulator [Oscillospiraceae bacterium]